MSIQTSNLILRLRTSMMSHMAISVRFKHLTLTPARVQVGRQTFPNLLCSHIQTTNSKSTKVMGFGTLMKFLHTGPMTAMKIDLNSNEGNWQEIKEFLLCQPIEIRRKYYRTDSIKLENIPVWNPIEVSDRFEGSHYPKSGNVDGKISVFSGDITRLEVDAVVNAANRTLLGGGGVDGAIHRAAGPLLKEECASLGGCRTGDAKVTCGYGLPAKYVIHTVGPIARGRVGEAEKIALRSCYVNSLRNAVEIDARSMAFPCISTGIYGYPPDLAVHEALATIRDFLEQRHHQLDRVVFCVFLPKDLDLYLENLPLYFPLDAPVNSQTRKDFLSYCTFTERLLGNKWRLQKNAVHYISWANEDLALLNS
ncbi:ADP-ribose glycohydrolase MACROD1 [Stigmatopora nigra]